MGKVIVTEFVSLDGVIEAQGEMGTLNTQVGRSRSVAVKMATNSSSTRPATPRLCCWDE